ncbi:MAG: DUF2807 domain-containing protein [Clostridia bacterium]|nr:DUF2807 domain-containing protein [Clostridia bacterium]
MYSTDDFGKMIAEKRRQNGLTQEALAKKLGISPQAVSKWENGIGYPDVTLFPPLSEALGVPIDTLFGSGKGSADGGYEGPEYFNGLSFVASNGSVACYSSKKSDKTEGGVVYFADGSTADLNTRVVINRGKGEIKIIEGEKTRGYSVNDSVSRTEELSPFTSVNIKLGIPCDLNVLKGEKPSLYLEGKQAFVYAAQWSAENGCFRLEFRSVENAGGKSNKITLVCPFEKGKEFSVSVNGGSTCHVRPDFTSVTAAINGSGAVDLQNGDRFDVIINGSGAVSADAASERFTGRINGSGYIGAKKAKNADLAINGSGEAEVKNVFGTLNANVLGSGMITAGGDVENLTVKISGSGSFCGDDLACERADICVSGSAETNIDRIRKESVEKLSKNAVLTVKSRGE